MKTKPTAFILALLATALLHAADPADIAAFREARFGMFIHYGLYAQLGGRWKGERMEYIGEWIQSRFRIPNAVYAAQAKNFNPRLFDADEWAREAKDAGMEYMVLTTKHHEGFAMFGSKASDYNIVDATPFKRDLFGELSAACRRHGIKVGLYYSQCLDWHEHDAADVVANRGTNRGNLAKGMDWGNSWDWPDASKKVIDRYLKAKVYPQLKELLTTYGDIFVIWFDCPMGMSREQTVELREYVRSLQPHTLVNSRIGLDLGDFGSLGDNQLLAGKSEFPLESPCTLNDTWGFKYDDHNWKSAYRIACMLTQTVSCNANFLLNIGPRPDGRFPDASSDVLAELGAWRRKTGFEIRGSKASPFPSALPWGWCTVARDGTLQLVVRREWTGDIELCGIRNRIRSATVPYDQEGTTVTLRLPQPDDMMPRVVRLAVEGQPDIVQTAMPQNGELVLLPSSSARVRSGGAAGGERTVQGAAAEKFGGTVCEITRRGAFSTWHHPGDAIVWKAFFPKPGVYRAMVTTESRVHSGVWAGQRTVCLSIGNESVTKAIEKDRSLPHTVYDCAESDIGKITVRKAGETEVSLENVSGGPSAHCHDLMKLRLVRE